MTGSDLRQQESLAGSEFEEAAVAAKLKFGTPHDPAQGCEDRNLDLEWTLDSFARRKTGIFKRRRKRQIRNSFGQRSPSRAVPHAAEQLRAAVQTNKRAVHPFES